MVDIEFNKERNTWNVFKDGEWYFESSDYEKADDVYRRCCLSEVEDDYDCDCE